MGVATAEEHREIPDLVVSRGPEKRKVKIQEPQRYLEWKMANGSSSR